MEEKLTSDILQEILSELKQMRGELQTIKMHLESIASSTDIHACLAASLHPCSDIRKQGYLTMLNRRFLPLMTEASRRFLAELGACGLPPEEK